MADFPEYTIRPSIKRVVVPQFLLTLFLAFVFYTGILINVALLNIPIPKAVTILILVILTLLVIIQSLLSYVQTSKTQYLVYRNRIQRDISYAMFSNVQDIQINRNFWDKAFDTGTITLQPGMKIAAVPNIEQTYAYIRQMVQYARTQYIQQ